MKEGLLDARGLVRFVFCTAVALAMATAPADGGSAQDHARSASAYGRALAARRGAGWRGNDAAHLRSAASRRAPGSSVDSPLPTFTRTFPYNGRIYTSRFVGSDPRKGPKSTHIPVLIVPLRLEFADGSARDATADLVQGRTVLDWVLHSPVFQTSHFSSSGVDQGDTQYGDALVRLNFWSEGGSDPGYHVVLDPKVRPRVTLTVPADKADLAAGTIDEAWVFDQQLAILDAMNPDPAALVLLVLSHDLSIGGGILGWHGATGLPSRPGGPRQTYALVGALDSSAFGWPDPYVGVIMVHEIAEWLNDPFGDNEVPPWSRITTFDSVSTAESYNLDILEVSDAFETDWDGFYLWTTDEGIDFVIQDTAYFDYFTRQKKSRSYGGWYSFFGASAPSTSSFDESLFDVRTFSVPGSLGTYLTGINGQGDLVGYYYSGADGSAHGMLAIGNHVTNVDVPGARFTFPTAVNRGGTIVGSYWDAGGALHGFVLDRGVFRTVDAVPGAATFLTAINDAGDIAGEYLPIGASASPFVGGLVIRGGQVQTVFPLGATDAFVSGISRSGTLAGSFTTAGDGNPATGFVGRPGAYAPVVYGGPAPAAWATYPSLLTDGGVLGGTLIDTFGFLNGFYRINGAWSRVGCGFGTNLNGMNEAGVAAGYVDWEGGIPAHGIIVTPKARN